MSGDVRFARIREEEYLFLLAVLCPPSIFSNDLLVVRWKREVVEDGGALDEPMAKLLSVVRWPSVGSGEPDPRRRTTA